MENITGDVTTDLWPLYTSGEASPDTRKLVEDFLSKDPEFARTLRENGHDVVGSVVPPPLPLDHEFMTLAMISTCLAFGRIVSDTSFDVSPRNFIIHAVIAVCFWVAFFVHLFRGRRAVLLRLR